MKKLIKIANKLDDLGYVKIADMIDAAVKDFLFKSARTKDDIARMPSEIFGKQFGGYTSIKPVNIDGVKQIAYYYEDLFVSGSFLTGYLLLNPSKTYSLNNINPERAFVSSFKPEGSRSFTEISLAEKQPLSIALEEPSSGFDFARTNTEETSFEDTSCGEIIASARAYLDNKGVSQTFTNTEDSKFSSSPKNAGFNSETLNALSPSDDEGGRVFHHNGIIDLIPVITGKDIEAAKEGFAGAEEWWKGVFEGGVDFGSSLFSGLANIPDANKIPKTSTYGYFSDNGEEITFFDLHPCFRSALHTVSGKEGKSLNESDRLIGYLNYLTSKEDTTLSSQIDEMIEGGFLVKSNEMQTMNALVLENFRSQGIVLEIDEAEKTSRTSSANWKYDQETEENLNVIISNKAPGSTVTLTLLSTTAMRNPTINGQTILENTLEKNKDYNFKIKETYEGETRELNFTIQVIDSSASQTSTGPGNQGGAGPQQQQSQGSDYTLTIYAPSGTNQDYTLITNKGQSYTVPAQTVIFKLTRTIDGSESMYDVTQYLAMISEINSFKMYDSAEANFPKFSDAAGAREALKESIADKINYFSDNSKYTDYDTKIKPKSYTGGLDNADIKCSKSYNGSDSVEGIVKHINESLYEVLITGANSDVIKKRAWPQKYNSGIIKNLKC